MFSAIANEFNVQSIPYVMIIDKHGDIRYRIIGFKEDQDYLGNLEAWIISLLKERQ